MNIFLQEIKMLLKANVIWTIALIFVMSLFMVLFSMLQSDFDAFYDMVGNFPEFVQGALGFNSMNIATVLGFYGFALVYIYLIAAIQAMNYGMTVVSQELSQNVADFLLTKPVTRTDILKAKLTAVVAHLLDTNITYTLATYILLSIVKTADFSIKTFLLLQFSIFIFQLLFAAIGIFLAVFLKRIKSVLPVTLGVVFGFFIIDLLNQSLGDVKLSYFSPFAYFKPSYIINNESFDLVYLIIAIALIIILTVITFIRYHRRDIPSI